jgi:putative thioredoxin
MAHDVTNFDEDVLQASFHRPILVDFWAAWCAPCRVLGPVLEKLASEQADRWTLAKVDTEAFPEVSAQYQIRGIPAVKLIVDGKVVDEFTGALPEPEIRKWLNKVIPSENKKSVALATELFGALQYADAQRHLEEILAQTPTEPNANTLMARILAFSDPDRATAFIDTALAVEPAFITLSESLKTLSLFRDWTQDESSASSSDSETPGQADFLRAITALKQNSPEEVIVALLEVIKVNRYLEDDASRKIGVAVFIVLGDSHPLTRTYRRTFDMWLT